MSLRPRICQFIQLPKYPRCELPVTMVLDVKRPGDRWRKEEYCQQHGGYRKHQYSQLKIRFRQILAGHLPRIAERDNGT